MSQNVLQCLLLESQEHYTTEQPKLLMKHGWSQRCRCC